MKKIIIALIVLVVIGIGTYYLVFSNSSSGTPTDNAPQATSNANTDTTQIPATSNVSVEIKNFSFNPPTLTIKTGTKVTWTNNDNAPHTIVSDSGNLFSSETLSPGQSFSFIFTNIGNVNYHCGIHPTMKGTVVVTNTD